MNYLIAFLLALLAGMGVGGGGLLVLYLTLVQNMPQTEAQGVNLLFFLCASASTFVVNRKKRHFLWKDTLLLAVSGILMTFPGALLAMGMEGDLLRKTFGGLLILSGLLSLFRKKT